MELDKLLRISPTQWPGKTLEAQPGDMTILVPDGLGISGPFPIRPWDDPFGSSPAGYYALLAAAQLGGTQATATANVVSGSGYTSAPIVRITLSSNRVTIITTPPLVSTISWPTTVSRV